MSEISNYKKNSEHFLSTLTGSTIKKVVYSEDLNPTFIQHKLPFEFKYCFSIILVTNKGNYSVITAHTSMGYETFWIEQIHSLTPGTSEKLFNSKVTTVTTGKRNCELPYKIVIELESGKLFLYAAELYNDLTGLRKVLNDEMVFVFETSHDAEMFEAFETGG